MPINADIPPENPATSFKSKLEKTWRQLELDEDQCAQESTNSPKVDKSGKYVNNADHNIDEQLDREISEILGDALDAPLISPVILDEPSLLGGEREGNIEEELSERHGDQHDAEIQAAQRQIVDEFSKALVAEGLSLEQLKNMAMDIAETRLAGRFLQVSEYFDELAQLPPARAPELWPGMEASNETPATFIERVYERWLSTERMHRGALRKIDKQLSIDFVSWKRSNEVSPELEENLPTIQDYNTRQIEKRKQLKGQEARRVARVAADRKHTM